MMWVANFQLANSQTCNSPTRWFATHKFADSQHAHYPDSFSPTLNLDHYRLMIHHLYGLDHIPENTGHSKINPYTVKHFYFHILFISRFSDSLLIHRDWNSQWMMFSYVNSVWENVSQDCLIPEPPNSRILAKIKLFQIIVMLGVFHFYFISNGDSY